MSDFMNTIKAISLICFAGMAGGHLGTPVGAVISLIVRNCMPPRRMPIKYSRTRLRESIEWVSENKAGFSADAADADDAADGGIDLPADISDDAADAGIDLPADISADAAYAGIDLHADISDDAADAGTDLPADIELILTHFSLQIKSDTLSYPEWWEDILSALDSKEHCCGCYSGEQSDEEQSDEEQPDEEHSS